MGVLMHLEEAQKRKTKDADMKTIFCEACGKSSKITEENFGEECPKCGSKEVRPN